MPRTRTHKPLFLTPLLATIAMASVVQPAVAASQRFASPSGSGVLCTAALPCDLLTAVDQASAGDDVTLLSGTYPLGVTVTDPAEITIHGEAGKPRPRIVFSGLGQAGFSLPNGSTLRDLEIDQQYPDRLAIDGTAPVLDQLIVRNPGDPPCSVSLVGGTITNSIVVTGGTGICGDVDNSANTSSVRNVTAVSTDPGAVAIETVAHGAGGVSTLILTNVIAQGGPGGSGLMAWTDGSGARSLISANHSNSSGSETAGTNAQVADGGSNQTTAPTFVNAAAGDYHEAPGSVTIDAGLTQQANGPQDVDGDPRSIGASTDIGADEFVPPAPVQPAQPGQPSQPGQPGTSTTSSTPASTTPGAPTPHAVPFPGVTLLSPLLSLDRRTILLALWCPSNSGRCSGQTTLTARFRVKHSRRMTTVVLGRARFSIAPMSERLVIVHVSRAGLQALARLHRLNGSDTNTADDGTGQTKTTVAGIYVRPLAKRRHR